MLYSKDALFITVLLNFYLGELRFIREIIPNGAQICHQSALTCPGGFRYCSACIALRPNYRTPSVLQSRQAI